MRTLIPALQAHLDTGATTLAWCWRLEAADGTVLGFTDHDQPLTVDGTLYEADSGFSASSVTEALGLAVGSLSAAGALQSAALTESDLIDGKWDNAAITLTRANWADPTQFVVIKAGNLGEISRGDVAFTAEVRGIAHRWQEPRGRLYGAACDARLGDARCGVDLTNPAFRAVATVVSIAGARLTVSGLQDFAHGFFARGFATLEGGRVLDVLAHTGGDPATLTFQTGPLSPPEHGATLTVTAGCDKRLSTCRDKFANVINFQGFAHMPGDDFAVQYANGDSTGDGTTRYAQF